MVLGIPTLRALTRCMSACPVLAASQLTAFQNVYKAACKRYSIPPDKPLLEEIEQKLQDFKHLEKVCVRGDSSSQSLR